MNNSGTNIAEPDAQQGPLPAALQIAEQVSECQIEGEYDLTTDTWSDRNFASAGPKKHNEAM